MANYKTADKLPILEEVTETTYALVEDSGSLKRVSGELLGGKSNYCVINVDQGEALEPSEINESSRIYTCNMTHDELMEALQTKTLAGFSIYIYSGYEIYNGAIGYIYFGPVAPGIMIEYYDPNFGSSTLQFSSDGTISRHVEDS